MHRGQNSACTSTCGSFRSPGSSSGCGARRPLPTPRRARLRLSPWRRGWRSSPTSTLTGTRSRPCSRRWSARSPTSSGASATSSVRAAAEPVLRGGRRRASLCLAGNHISACSGRSTLGIRPRRGHGRALDSRRARGGLTHVPRVTPAAGPARRRPALPREPARPRVGLRALSGGGGSGLRADRGTARARRSQPRPPGDHARRRPPRRRRRARRHADAASTGAAAALNPGSVGQPRDGDPRAAWLLL